MTDIGERERLRDELLDRLILLYEEIERLREEVEEWRERWQAERRDHEATIRHFDKLMNEVPT